MTRPRIYIYPTSDEAAWIHKQKRGVVSKLLHEFLAQQMNVQRQNPEEQIQMQLEELDEKEKKKEREMAVVDAKKRLAKAEKLLEEAVKSSNAGDLEEAETLGTRAFKLGITLKHIKEALPPFIFNKIRKSRKVD